MNDLNNPVAALRADLAALFRELDLMRADSERLKWLVSEGYVSALHRYQLNWAFDTEDLETDDGDADVCIGRTWREAVDAAMAKEAAHAD